jgi:hypothetical protein
MIANLLIKEDTSELEKLLLDSNNNLKPIAFDVVNKFSQNVISLFCLKYAVYQIVTFELIDFLAQQIGDKKAIEIGAGNGCLGRSLGIKMTDNFQQNEPLIRAYYNSIKQPVIKYGHDVEKLDGNLVIEKYHPDILIGAWVTQRWKPHLNEGNAAGIDELQFKNRIEKYILVGNEKTHGDKEIRHKMKCEIIKAPWLISRSLSRDENSIYIYYCK